MKGYILHAGNLSNEDKTYVQFFGRLENGESFCVIKSLEPYFFIEKKHADKLKNILNKFKIENTNLTNFHGEKVTKISSESQTEINKLVTMLHGKDIDTYEADLKPHMRLIIDQDLLGTCEIKGEYEKAERFDRLYREPELTPASFKPKLKIASIDTETDREGGLFCIGLYSEEVKKVFMITKKKIKNVVSCIDERDCLERFKDAILTLDPDIIVGWNVIDFDFVLLKKLFEKHKMPFDIGRDNSEVRLRIESGFFKSSKVIISGRQVMDGLNLIKDPFIQEAPSIRNIKFDSLTLEDVSQAILKEGKVISGDDRHEKIIEFYKKDQEKLAHYNLTDCRLVYDLLEKTNTIDLAVERSQLTGIPIDKVTASIIAFDSLYIREARKRGLVSPTTFFSKKEERIKGGYVMESKSGIYHNVIVLDFKSLYPSIIKTFNIDPSSFLEKNEKGSIEAPNGAHFTNSDGILPQIISQLHEAREKAKKEKRELASYAIKIIMNSFFGILANPNSRYFSLDVANAITHFAQHFIKMTAKKIEGKGYEVIYSDTDSVFIKIDDKDDSEEIGNRLPKEINSFYDKHIKDTYKRKSYLELEFKKHYIAFLLPKTRDLEKGSKKRYAGLVKKNGKEDIEIVGLEAIRGDWTEAAREFQIKLLDQVFHKKEFLTFVKSYVKDLKAGKMDSKLVYSKSIRKELSEYTKTTPPHVKAARKLDALEGTTINYYITEDGPEPIQKLKHAIDYDHYIKKQIAPIANTILAFFNKTFEDVLENSKQTKLFS